MKGEYGEGMKASEGGAERRGVMVCGGRRVRLCVEGGGCDGVWREEGVMVCCMQRGLTMYLVFLILPVFDSSYIETRLVRKQQSPCSLCWFECVCGGMIESIFTRS